MTRPTGLRLILICGATLLGAASPLQDTRDAEVAVANDELNETFATLIRRLGKADGAALRRAERAWIAFRDAECEVQWGDRRDCVLQRTVDRERQLRETTYFAANGRPFTLPPRRE